MQMSLSRPLAAGEPELPGVIFLRNDDFGSNELRRSRATAALSCENNRGEASLLPRGEGGG